MSFDKLYGLKIQYENKVADNNKLQKSDTEMFAEALIESNYFDFPGFEACRFSVQKKSRPAFRYPMMWTPPIAIREVVWEVDLKLFNGVTVGTVSFNLGDRNNVTFSNESVRQMVQNKKSPSVSEVIAEFSSDQKKAEAVLNEVKSFLALHESAIKSVDSIYQTIKADSLKAAEYNSVRQLLIDILDNPKNPAVVGFDVDKLEGGSSFFQRNVGYIVISVFGCIGLAAWSLFIYAATTCFGGAVDPFLAAIAGGFGGIFLALLEGAFLITVGTLIVSCLHKERKEVASEVAKLLTRADQLTEGAVQTIVDATRTVPPVSYAYGPVVSQTNQSAKNGWSKVELELVPTVETSAPVFNS